MVLNSRIGQGWRPSTKCLPNVEELEYLNADYFCTTTDLRASPTQDNVRETGTGKTGRKAEKRPIEATYSDASVDRSTVDTNVLGSIDEKLNKLDILDLLRSDTLELKTSVEYSHYLIGQLRAENHRSKGTVTFWKSTTLFHCSKEHGQEQGLAYQNS